MTGRPAVHTGILASGNRYTITYEAFTSPGGALLYEACYEAINSARHSAQRVTVDHDVTGVATFDATTTEGRSRS